MKRIVDFGEIPAVSPIADVLALWGLDGWLSPPLHMVVPATAPVLGRVSTISLVAGESGRGLGPMYDVLSNSLDDHFLVIGGATAIDGAVFGEILATAAHKRRACGVLVDGNVRDHWAMAAVGLPIYAASQCVVGPRGTAHVATTGHPVTIGDVEVGTDDFIVADSSGCVRIPHTEIEAVLEGGRQYATAEAMVVRALQQGTPMRTAYLFKQKIVDHLRRT